MSWLLRLSNWLSGGALDRYQEQTELAKAKLKQAELKIKELTINNKQLKKELGQANAQIKINRGFQIELGDTHIRLQQLETELEEYQQKLISTQEQLKQSQIQLKTTAAELNNSFDWLANIRNPIEVVEIKKILPKGDFDSLWGFGLISPQSKSLTNTGAIIIKGWVLGKKATAKTIRVIYQEDIIIEIPINLPSPMITQQYPDIANAGNSGFESCLTVMNIPIEHELKLHALLEDESIIPLCAISLKGQDN